MDKTKCPKCGTTIMVKGLEETVVKTRLLKVSGGKKDALCPKCKTFVHIELK